MPNYRVFKFGERGGIVDGYFVESATDEEARSAARAMLEASEEGELWLGTRFVGRLAGSASAASAAIKVCPDESSDQGEASDPTTGLPVLPVKGGAS